MPDIQEAKRYEFTFIKIYIYKNFCASRKSCPPLDLFLYTPLGRAGIKQDDIWFENEGAKNQKPYPVKVDCFVTNGLTVFSENCVFIN